MMNIKKGHRGFSIVELMIVVAIISILAAIAIPGLVGMQNKARRGAMQRSVAAAEPEIQGWFLSARKGDSNLREADTNGNGAIEATDLTDYDLSLDLATANQLCQRYINTRWLIKEEFSPWNPAVSLWTTNALTTNGRISCRHDSGSSVVTLIARDMSNIQVYIKVLSLD